ncbi:hypothetical protein Tco_0358450 [Tanacetum coccineum]
MLFGSRQSTTTRLFLLLQLRILLSTLSMIWVIEKKSNTYQMSPRAPVLQILWGIINRANVDYAERMWEEFTQPIHTFTEDKKNLAQHT